MFDKQTIIDKLNLIFLVFAIAGFCAYMYFKQSLMGGVGLSTAIFSIISYMHFRSHEDFKTKAIESGITWFLVALVFISIIIIVANHLMGGPIFYSGLGAGISFVSAMAYIAEVLIRTSDGIR